MHVLWRKLKKKRRAFPEQVGWKRWLHTLKQVNTLVVEKMNFNEHDFDGEANFSGVVDFHCMQMSLVMSMLSIFCDDWNEAPCSSRFFFSLVMI